MCTSNSIITLEQSTGVFYVIRHYREMTVWELKTLGWNLFKNPFKQRQHRTKPVERPTDISVEGTYSLRLLPWKKLAHSKQVFLLPTQNTEGIPTISIIRYLMRNRTRSGRLVRSTYKKHTHTQQKWLMVRVRRILTQTVWCGRKSWMWRDRATVCS